MKSVDMVSFRKGIVRKDNGEEIEACILEGKSFGLLSIKVTNIPISKNVWHEVGKTMGWK